VVELIKEKIKEKMLLITGTGITAVGILNFVFDTLHILLSVLTILFGLVFISAYGEKTI